MFHNKFGILSVRFLFCGSITVHVDIKSMVLSGGGSQGYPDQIVRRIGLGELLQVHNIRTGRQYLSAERSSFPHKKFF